MTIPISVDSLLNANIVEQTRIEYKAGWNPKEVIHTLCAFANDYSNIGGGYLVIGVEEEEGLPKRPVKGIGENQVDRIQKELLNLGHRISPVYLPECEPVFYEEKLLLLIWAPGGYDRPYQAPVSLAKASSERAYYIRRFSNTVKANRSEVRQLRDLSEVTPFDDRVNLTATLSDIKKSWVLDYLREVDSTLLAQRDDFDTAELATILRIVKGPIENVRPLNIGLMFFADNPAEYFRYARIEVVDIPDPTGQGMVERTFTGPLNVQLKSALQYIRNNVIAELVQKVPGQAEAVRRFNYPYEAIEEALVNAIYHKSYQIPEPVTVRIERDKLSILSIPGPDPSISDEDLSVFRLMAAHNRNRRIGEFLKEVKMIEGRNTGIPTMVAALRRNESDPPLFQTDDERSYFQVTFKINRLFLDDIRQKSITDWLERERPKGRRTREQIKTELMLLLKTGSYSRREAYAALGYTGSPSSTFISIVDEMIDEEQLVYITHEKSPSAKLTLKTTENLNSRN